MAAPVGSLVQSLLAVPVVVLVIVVGLRVEVRAPLWREKVALGQVKLAMEAVALGPVAAAQAARLLPAGARRRVADS